MKELMTSYRLENFDEADTAFEIKIQLYESSDEDLWEAVKTKSRVFNQEKLEITQRTKIPFDYTLYVDSSYSVQQRKVYSREEALEYNITNNLPLAEYGLNGYGSIHGAMFTDNHTFYGYQSSNSILLHALPNQEFELMLQRVIWHYDDKGVTTNMESRYSTGLDQWHFFASSPSEYIWKRNFMSD